MNQYVGAWYYNIANKFIKLVEDNNTSEENKHRYLIFDDTTTEKRGKKNECLDPRYGIMLSNAVY